MTSNNYLKTIDAMLISLILIALLCALSCRECPTESENHNNNPPDTTSHNFIWEIDTLGLYSSYLNDVWIVGENNIWVVGYIRVPDPDSSFDGTGRETFNAARWDGEKWNLMRIVNSAPLYSIWYFSEDDIWVSSGFPKHWDGNQWTMYHLQNMGLGSDVSTEYIWASSPNDIYFVGYKGSIVHYDGSKFRKIDHDSDLRISDVWGISKNAVYFCQYDISYRPSGILFYNGLQVSQFFYSESIDYDSKELAGRVHTIWAFGDTLYAGCSAGVWKESLKTGKGKMASWPEICNDWVYPNKIRGQNYSDIFVVGNWMKMAHFNGVSWKSFSSIFGGVGDYFSVAIKGDLVCAVGRADNSRAIIVIGRR